MNEDSVQLLTLEVEKAHLEISKKIDQAIDILGLEKSDSNIKKLAQLMMNDHNENKFTYTRGTK